MERTGDMVGLVGCLYSLDWTTGLDYWTHPKLHKMPFPAIFSAGQKLNMLIDSPKLLAYPVEASSMTFLESVEVKGHVHI